MKFKYFVTLSVLLHIIPFFYLEIWNKPSNIEIIETELTGSLAKSSPNSPEKLKQKSSIPATDATKSQIKNQTEVVNSQTGVVNESGPEKQGSGSSTVAPKLLNEILAPYPKEARRAHIEGDVLLKITISEGGKVEKATVINSLGYGLDEAALTAIQQFLFSPGFKDGKVVKTEIKYRYKFRLD